MPLGYKYSAESKLKMSLAKLGRKTGRSWNKGKTTPDEVKKKMSLAHKGKVAYVMTEKTRQKIREARKLQQKTNKGQHWKLSEETKNRMSLAKLRDREKGTFWKGGITPINVAIRMSRKYKLWRKAVFERDNYTCRFCGIRGAQIHADHIKAFAKFPELRFVLDNGRTLCVPCHKTTDTYLKR